MADGKLSLMPVTQGLGLKESDTIKLLFGDHQQPQLFAAT